MDNGFPDWIRPQELMPPKHIDILGYVIDKRFSERTGIYIVGLLDGGWWVRYTEGSFPISEDHVISHWRFLPNPPEQS